MKNNTTEMPQFFKSLDKLKPVYDALSHILLVICKLFLIADILITTVSVAGRYISFIPDPAWSEEVVLSCMTYMAVLSAALAIRKKSHIRMQAFDRYLPAGLLKALDLIADVCVLILGVVMLIVGFHQANALHHANAHFSSMPNVSKFWKYFPIPLAGFFMIVFELEAIVNDLKAFWRRDTEYDLKNQTEKIVKEALK